MSQYVVDSSRTVPSSQPWLIGAPLAITMVFCFCFVALAPNKHSNTVNISAGSSADSDHASPLPPIGMSSAAVQTLSPLNQTNVEGATKIDTQTPQPGATSATGLQSAGQNGQTPKTGSGIRSSSTSPITIPKTPIRSVLDR